jgi:hypothetical protein
MNDLNGGSAIAIPRYMRCNSNVCNSSRQARAPKDGDLPLTRVDTPPSARKDTSRTLSNTTWAEASTRPSSHSLPMVSICDIKEAHSDDRRGSQHFFWSQFTTSIAHNIFATLQQIKPRSLAWSGDLSAFHREYRLHVLTRNDEVTTSMAQSSYQQTSSSVSPPNIH